MIKFAFALERICFMNSHSTNANFSWLRHISSKQSTVLMFRTCVFRSSMTTSHQIFLECSFYLFPSTCTVIRCTQHYLYFPQVQSRSITNHQADWFQYQQLLSELCALLPFFQHKPMHPSSHSHFSSISHHATPAPVH